MLQRTLSSSTKTGCTIYLAFSSAFFLSVLTTTLMEEVLPRVPVPPLVLLTRKSSPIISFMLTTSQRCTCKRTRFLKCFQSAFASLNNTSGTFHRTRQKKPRVNFQLLLIRLLDKSNTSLTSPNCPSPSFSRNLRFSRGNSITEKSSFHRTWSVFGTEYKLFPLTPWKKKSDVIENFHSSWNETNKKRAVSSCLPFLFFYSRTREFDCTFTCMLGTSETV